MNGVATRLRTFAALGPANAVRVLGYRLGLKLGIHPVQRIAAATIPGGPFFPAPEVPPVAAALPTRWRHEALLFGAYRMPIGTAPPPWTVDPLAQPGGADPAPEALPPWWRIGDFAGGDIKRIWELSRFDWVLAFAQQARQGDALALERLNGWIADWTRRNPPYRGPNWKCAQEASIRLLHLSVAAMLLGQKQGMSRPLRALVEAHVRRIVPTLSYARAQDNNHATSEAAGLFVAGAWLAMADAPGGGALARRGAALLERATARLFAQDGSFSQYSLNYHRLALDSLVLAELWRRCARLPPFSEGWRRRAAAAADWLWTMVDPASGDAPNLGANDGANLLPLTDAAYRDYRPAVQLSAALFHDARAYQAGPWDEALVWLGIASPPGLLALPAARVFDEGGYAVLRQGAATVLLRYPRFRFRPGQADALHVDLWLDGINLLRDGGSYSYNTEPRWIDYFGGVESHNTVQFDDQPQMPRLSRFLLGDWLATSNRGAVSVEGGQGFRAGYRHRRGWSHLREARLSDGLQVIDEVAGFKSHATLRWRLPPGPWDLAGAAVTNGTHRLSIKASMPIAAISLVTGWESRHYLEKTEVPVLEVVTRHAGQIISDYRWTP